MANDSANHAVRDGDYPLVYIAAAGGIYKYFPHANVVLPLLPLQVGEVGFMVGYGGLGNVVPPVISVASGILIPTHNAPNGFGGVWSSDNNEWTLHNVPSSVNSWAWASITVNPINTQHWVMIGSTVGGSVGPVGTTFTPDVGAEGGSIVDRTTGLSPLWQTLDGGTTWSELHMSCPQIRSGENAAYIETPFVFVRFSKNGTLGVAATMQGIGEFFGNTLSGIAVWTGPPTGLIALGGRADDRDKLGYAGVHPSRGGVTLYSLLAGNNSDFVVTGYYGGQEGEPVPRYAIALQQTPGQPFEYIDFNNTTSAGYGAIASDASGVAISASYISGGKTATSTPYSIPPTIHTPDAPVAVESTLPFVTAYTVDGIFFSTENGIVRAPSPTQPFEFDVATRTLALVSATGGAWRSVVARERFTSPSAGEIAKFHMWNGTEWSVIDGPTDTNARNQYLSGIGLALVDVELE